MLSVAFMLGISFQQSLAMEKKIECVGIECVLEGVDACYVSKNSEGKFITYVVSNASNNNTIKKGTILEDPVSDYESVITDGHENETVRDYLFRKLSKNIFYSKSEKKNNFAHQVCEREILIKSMKFALIGSFEAQDINAYKRDGDSYSTVNKPIYRFNQLKPKESCSEGANPYSNEVYSYSGLYYVATDLKGEKSSYDTLQKLLSANKNLGEINNYYLVLILPVCIVQSEDNNIIDYSCGVYECGISLQGDTCEIKHLMFRKSHEKSGFKLDNFSDELLNTIENQVFVKNAFEEVSCADLFKDKKDVKYAIISPDEQKKRKQDCIDLKNKQEKNLKVLTDLDKETNLKITVAAKIYEEYRELVGTPLFSENKDLVQDWDEYFKKVIKQDETKKTGEELNSTSQELFNSLVNLTAQLNNVKEISMSLQNDFFVNSDQKHVKKISDAGQTVDNKYKEIKSQIDEYIDVSDNGSCSIKDLGKEHIQAKLEKVSENNENEFVITENSESESDGEELELRDIAKMLLEGDDKAHKKLNKYAKNAIDRPDVQEGFIKNVKELLKEFSERYKNASEGEDNKSNKSNANKVKAKNIGSNNTKKTAKNSGKKVEKTETKVAVLNDFVDEVNKLENN